MTPPAPRSAVERFRSRGSRQTLHPAEQRLLWVVCAHLVFLPWALGGMREWAQWISAGFAVVGFVLALWPREYDAQQGGGVAFTLYAWPKLLRFPLFWLGFAFLAYGAVGALNPAWEFKESAAGWWMEQVAHVTWLPSGVRVPFEREGPWRMLLIYGAVWLSICTLWIGFTRRKTFQVFFSVLAGNAFLLAALGIAQRALEAKKIFWLIEPNPGAHYFVSSFTYKNHAGAYFNLMLGLCAGLAYWHYRRSERRLDKSSPAGLFAFFGTAVAMIVFFSYSRTATLLMFGFLAIALVIVAWQLVFGATVDRRRPWLLVLLVIAFVYFGRIGLVALGTERTFERIQQLQSEVDQNNARLLASQATWDMAQDKLTTGWGAGSFRFLFPHYQQKYPSIWSRREERLQWHHAHNDYAELLAEYGIAGCALLVLGLGYVGWLLVRHQAPTHSLGFFTLFGLVLLALHCAVDFNTFNPAILTTAAALAISLPRWLELEEQAGGV